MIETHDPLLTLGMTKTVEELVTDFVHVKMKELPSSELMRVSEVMDILLDLQQQLLTSSSSVLEPTG